MSATVYSGDGVALYCEVYYYPSSAISADSDPNTPPGLGSSLISTISKYDPYMRSLWKGTFTNPGRVAVVPLYPTLDSASYERLSFLSRPVDPSPVVSENYDSTYYASTWHSIASIASLLGTGAPLRAPAHSGERFCRHSTFGGSCVYPSGILASEPPLASASGIPITNDSNMSAMYDVLLRSAEFSDFYRGVDILGEPSPYHVFQQVSLASFLENNPKAYFGGGTQFWRVECDFNITSNTSDLLSFTVSTTCSLGGPYLDPSLWCTYTWKYRVTYDFRALFSSIVLRELHDDWVCTSGFEFKMLDSSCSDVSRDLSLNEVDVAVGNRVIAVGFGTPSYTSRTDEIISVPSSNPYVSLNNFRACIDSRWSEILSSATFSAADAIQSLGNGTHTDVLQTLEKLPDYKSAIPQLREAIDLLGRIAHKDLSLSTAKDIVDLASSTILQGSFQWRPALQLITTEIPLMVKSLGSLKGRGNLVVGYGKFEFNFEPGVFQRNSSHLATKTKIVVDISASALASTLLGVDALGILPKPSNLWDLVPFSFVANWFTGVGASIKRAEYVTFMSTIPAYYVHTYSFQTPFTDQELASWEMSSSRSHPLSGKVFYRDVSVYSPLPRDNGFGFGVPTQLPPLATVASLLWQVLT